MSKNSFEFRRGEISGKGKAFQELASFLRVNNINSLLLIDFLVKKLKDFDDELAELEMELMQNRCK